MKHLSKSELLHKTKALVTEERRITLELVEALREIEHRLLFAELGYGSLFEFVTKHLGLSEGSAQRRIQVMRLVRDIPEAKTALESGKISLSNAAKVQSFFQMEKKQGHAVAIKDKLEILSQVETLSQRQCEQKLFEISPQSIPQERLRVVAQNHQELTLVISGDLRAKLERLKGLLAHSLPEASYAELLEYMADSVLQKMEKQKGLSPNPDKGVSNHTAAVQTKPLPSGTRVNLSKGLRSAVWTRAQGQCEYVHSDRRCSSRYRLELDHITPIALNGSNDLSNLRMLCRIHNQQQAREKLGPWDHGAA